MDKEVIVRHPDGGEAPDRVAVEEPLQITVDGHPVAVLMRTPGDDADLVRGFLRTEGVLRHGEEMRALDLEARPNHAHVFLRDDTEWDVTKLSRNLFSASSCGICGKATIEAVMGESPPLPEGPIIPRASLLAAPERMLERQSVFARTGGLHACAWFTAEGELGLIREDVGRHNAMDKVIGAGIAAGLPLAEGFLMVSGRLSFELVQKALAARVGVVAAVSAPSSLAVEFAERANQTLVGFLRPPRFNLYTHPLRIG
ncbi:formate dehydrogenase accessory sulfurtransferase FdhD [Luteolibacter ambystomatis]|uniref:Sulfur carrier protein FdhD n=1 Tax=Luteolibacter ambystomatis TaxID=2824561 RepID=A0A975G9F6_9BACT|nr:formate dehydrogenase accessory sulfurtransferase FdhD [Luteolibacter ambystomatis]QUE50770.1 formate dehydrogenase accessory sulfurtransferase FdhD [Luteolibacter ambystomatis]